MPPSTPTGSQRLASALGAIYYDEPRCSQGDFASLPSEIRLLIYEAWFQVDPPWISPEYASRPHDKWISRLKSRLKLCSPWTAECHPIFAPSLKWMRWDAAGILCCRPVIMPMDETANECFGSADPSPWPQDRQKRIQLIERQLHITSGHYPACTTRPRRPRDDFAILLWHGWDIWTSHEWIRVLPTSQPTDLEPWISVVALNVRLSRRNSSRTSSTRTRIQRRRTFHGFDLRSFNNTTNVILFGPAFMLLLLPLLMFLAFMCILSLQLKGCEALVNQLIWPWMEPICNSLAPGIKIRSSRGARWKYPWLI